MPNSLVELEPQSTTDAEIQRNPEALASAEDIKLVNQALDIIIDSTPNEFVWTTTASRGIGDSVQQVKNIRLMSQPAHIDQNGRKMGESFTWISFFDDEAGQRQVMVTEDQGSASPWGDVLNNAGVIVRKIRRNDTAFLPDGTATVRRSDFTFGPAQLEKEQNEAQVNNPFTQITNAQIDRIGEILANGSIHSHDGNNRLPPFNQLQTIPVANILLQE